MRKPILYHLLSGDYPRSPILTVVLIAVLAALAGAPFLFPGTIAYRTVSNICIFLVLAASYDLLLGYTAIVSFAHTMFFGIGAYGVAIVLQHLAPGWGAVLLGLAAALLFSLAMALVISFFSLRVQTIYFAMVTLAVASAFAIVVSKLYTLTGGEDGLTFNVPALVAPSFRGAALKGFDILGWLAAPARAPSRAVFTVHFGGTTIMYYLIFVASLALFLLMLRMMNSPFGRVLQAIRENAFRAEALGYRTVYYRTANTCISALIATLAGALYALSLQYISTGEVLSFNLMVDILLMTVIGGMGTLYGAVIGATLLAVANNYLQQVLHWAHGSFIGQVPLLGDLVSGERWFFWLGLLFVLSVYFFPRGVVGELRSRSEAARRKRAAGRI